MAVRKRRTRITATEKGAGQPAPSTVEAVEPKKGGIKRRTNLPVEPETPSLPGELGNVVSKLTASGDYGTPFIKGSSRRLSAERSRSGILAFDLALGGGWTKARAGMLYGERSSGKSTIALQSIAAMQLANPEAYAAWIDTEGTFDKAWAKKLGADLDRMVIVEPETGEHAVDLADAMLRAREIDMVAMDSIAMLVSMKELDESAEQDTMALQARLVGKYIRRTNNALLKERARGHFPILIHLNQFRMKVGLVFGDPRTLPGGKALEFSTTQQAETKNKEHVGKDGNDNDVVLFNEHNVKITKNKGGGPMKEAAFKLIRLKGFTGEKGEGKGTPMPEAWVDQAKTIYKYGTQVGVIDGAPSSFSVDGITGKFRGAAEFTKWALENPSLYGTIQQKIIDGFRKRWDL